jgi:hypothetical protein
MGHRVDTTSRTGRRSPCTTTAWRPSRLLHSERADIVRLLKPSVTGDELLVRLLYDLDLAEARLASSAPARSPTRPTRRFQLCAAVSQSQLGGVAVALPRRLMP